MTNYTPPLPPQNFLPKQANPPVRAVWLNAMDNLLQGNIPATGPYDPSIVSGQVQVTGPGGNLISYGDLVFELQGPNPSGIPCPVLSLGGAGKLRACITTDAQTPGLPGLQLIIAAGESDDATQPGGELLLLGGAGPNLAGPATIGGGTSLNGTGGPTTIRGGNSTNGIAGNLFLTGGLSGPLGGGSVHLVMTATGGAPGTVVIRVNSVVLYTITSTGAIFSGSAGAGLPGYVFTSSGPNGPATWAPTTGTALLYPQTQAELNAGIVPSNFNVPNGPTRYGAVGDGIADDAPALNRMGQVNGFHFAFDGTYKVLEKVQTNAFITLEGSTRQNTVITSPGFADYVMELGSAPAGPNPNVGELSRLRFFGAGSNLNTGVLHVNSLSHLWSLNKLLFQNCPCAGLVLDSIFDSYYYDLQFLSVGKAGDPSISAQVIIRNGCNNLYLFGLHMEQGPGGCLYIGPGCLPIMWIGGKIDQGYISQSSAAITVTANMPIQPSELFMDNVTVVGVANQYMMDITGSVKIGHMYFAGGSNKTAIFDHRSWGHIDATVLPTTPFSSMGPVISLIDLGNANFYRGNANALSPGNTPAVMQSKIFPVRAVTQLSVTANGTVTGNSIFVQTNAVASANDVYNGCYLVHNPTGTQAAGQAGARRKIIESFSNGLMSIQGAQGCTIDADWSIEYCGGHYTPNFRADNITMEQGMNLFAVLAVGATIAAPTYLAAGVASGGATNIVLTATSIPANTDVTGYFLIDEVTGEPFYINYGCDGASKIAVMYDRTADLNTSHTFSVVAGYAPNVEQNGAVFEWTFAGKKKFALVSQATLYGFDASNMPLWGIGVTGEVQQLPYTATMSLDIAGGKKFFVNVTDANAFSFNAPLNANNGDELVITINNISSGALSAATPFANFKAAAWTPPAAGNNRSVMFQYYAGVWKEISRTPADVPN